ncbi:MAG: hypothetical protein KDD46_01855 [Bdellovibrionales bacterium]|nr:hypothetical protein [Bdellovibrionales bacterium]
MKNATTFMRLGLILTLSFSLIYCGSEEATRGVNINITHNGEEIELIAPTIDTSKSGNDVTINLEVEASDYFSHFEIEKKIGTFAYEFFVDASDPATQDMDLADGTYKYRARTVYLIDDEYHFSEYSEESAETIGLISVPGDVEFGTL